MSFGNPTGGGSGPDMSMLSMLFRNMFPGMQFGQFNPNRNIVDTAEDQRFQAISWNATQFAANNQQVRDQVNALITRVNREFHMSIHEMTTQSAAEAVGTMMPYASMIGGGTMDALGFSAPAFTSELVGSQRSYLMQHPELDPKAAGERLGQIGAASFSQLYNQSGNPLDNTYGYRGGQLGALTSAATRRGWGGQDMLKPGKSVAAATHEHTVFAQRSGRLGSAVRDISPQFANLNAEQTMGMAEALSGGGSGMSMEDMGSHVRRLTQLGKAAEGTGLSTEQLHGLQAQASQYAQMLGLRGSASSATNERAIAERLTLHAMGPGIRNATGSDLNELTQKSERLGLQAESSDVGKQMAALMEIGELKGNRLGGEAAKAYAALQKGEYKFMEESDFVAMLRRSGVSGDEAIHALNDPMLLQKHGDKVGYLAREQQWAVDIAPNVSTNIANVLVGASSGKIAGKRADRISKRITELIHQSAGKEDPIALRAKIVAVLVHDEKLTEDEATAYVAAAMSAANEFAEDIGYKNIAEASALHSDELKTGARRRNQWADARANKAEGMAGKAQGNVLMRAIEGAKTGGLMGMIEGIFNVTPNEPTEPTEAEINAASFNPGDRRTEQTDVEPRAAKRQPAGKPAASRSAHDATPAKRGTPVVKEAPPNVSIAAVPQAAVSYTSPA